MLRARVVVPVFAFAVSTITAMVPFVTTAAADSAAVTIHDSGDIGTWGYGPSTETVNVGDTVTFSNTGASPHDATSLDGSWATPLLQTGQSASVTFSTPGTFNFTCVLHPWMKGTIVVAPAASAPAVAPSAPAPAAPAPADVAPASNPAPAMDSAPAQPSDTSTSNDAGS